MVGELVSPNDLPEYVTRFGSFTMAYSALQPGMRHLPVVGGTIAWMQHRRWRCALGDPFTAADGTSSAIGAFLDSCRADNARPVICQCGQATAEAAGKVGLFADAFGVEWLIDLASFDIKGKKGTHLRRWMNTALNAGVSTREVRSDDTTAFARIRSISATWLSEKEKHELKFMACAFRGRPEPCCRYFAAYQNGEMIAFVVFEPIFEDGKIIGYYSNADRYLKTAPNGTPVLIRLSAIDVFRAEGCRMLSLGLSPFHPANRGGPRQNPTNALLTRVSYNYGNFLYPFKGNAFHKEKWNCRTRPVFICHDSKIGWPAIIAAFRVNGVF